MTNFPNGQNENDFEVIDDNDSWDAFIAGAAEEPAPKATRRSNEKTYPCGQCAGTGRYQGARVHQSKSHCFACRGTGHFKTDPRKLAAEQQRRRRAKVKAFNEGLEAVKEQHPALFSELRQCYHFQEESNAFIMSLANQLFTRGTLSEKQIAAWYRGKEKLEAIRAEKAAEAEARKVSVDLSPIAEMFSTAMASGYKKPMYRANGLRIKPGKGGALYVLTEERTEFGHFGEQPGYEGKIAEGAFHPVKLTAADTADKLLAIAKDPKGEAVRHGQRTGRCSCCGRELTKHASIEAGIGPICAEKWGL